MPGKHITYIYIEKGYKMKYCLANQRSAQGQSTTKECGNARQTHNQHEGMAGQQTVAQQTNHQYKATSDLQSKLMLSKPNTDIWVQQHYRMNQCWTHPSQICIIHTAGLWNGMVLAKPSTDTKVDQNCRKN